MEDIIIKYLNFDEEFYLSTDASGTHLGAELFQKGKEGNHGTIEFTGRTLNEAEQRYHTTELELLAIVFGCKKF